MFNPEITKKLAGMISATKWVLLAFAGVTCVGFLMGKISEQVFMGASMLVLGFYFGSKYDKPQQQ
ncbi:MAG: hypothetical protein PHC53_02660 [Patescibacteria group bacterium]|nr:hypothetical protein [Patescibacteria group bacterium]